MKITYSYDTPIYCVKLDGFSDRLRYGRTSPQQKYQTKKIELNTETQSNYATATTQIDSQVWLNITTTKINTHATGMLQQ